MAYDSGEFIDDATKVARSIHLAVRRCEYITARWNSGMNTSFPNEGDTIKYNDLMNRVNELITLFTENSQAKLNQILALSDLTLPNDAG